MKTYGIYLAYSPLVDLRAEGLGRLLAEFVKEIDTRSDTKFVIACPSWTRKSLDGLFNEAGISTLDIEVIGPRQEPALLKLFFFYHTWRNRPIPQKKRSRSLNSLRRKVARIIEYPLDLLAATRSNTLLILLAIAGIFLLPFFAATLIIIGILNSLRFVARHSKRTRRAFKRYTGISNSNSRVLDYLRTGIHRGATASGFYRRMEKAETSLLLRDINRRTDIAAWFAPTAFWPQFNQITAPRLTCVPDIVLSDFPTGFARVDGNRFLQTFASIQRTIEGGFNFVTYSSYVKFHTLVGGYCVDPNIVDVVPHGANRLDRLLSNTGALEDSASIDKLCAVLFRSALSKAIGTANASNFDSGSVNFIFYASQFRPSKNVISLLRAYDYLLKRRYIGHKLVLTGNPLVLPEVNRFIREHNLQNDVLCLHGLSTQELAACYRLADLAVNPSLSEGGCPFTLTEALSVETPVVMARIAVTEEVITEPDLQDMMLFDPYDWRDMASRIEWALEHHDALLERQLKLFNKLAQRTWRDVVNEYIMILDRISAPATRTGAPQ